MVLKRKIVKTADGSSSIYIEDWKEHYHSKHGAVQEGQYVFIKNGLNTIDKNPIHILEYGLGTGLNALLTYRDTCINTPSIIRYTALEKYPLSKSESNDLDYSKGEVEDNFFERMHQCQWEQQVEIAPNFFLEKKQVDFMDFERNQYFDLIYFDAFGSRVQPDLWEKPLLEKVINNLKPGGRFVTYACRGSLKRILTSLDCEVHKLPGPPGKREMTIAIKR